MNEDPMQMHTCTDRHANERRDAVHVEVPMRFYERVTKPALGFRYGGRGVHDVFRAYLDNLDLRVEGLDHVRRIHIHVPRIAAKQLNWYRCAESLLLGGDYYFHGSGCLIPNIDAIPCITWIINAHEAE